MNYNRPNGGYERDPWRKKINSKSSKKLKKLWTTAIQTETKFLSGRHWNQDIGGVIQTDPNYCIWILENTVVWLKPWMKPSNMRFCVEKRVQLVR
jgi:hypothetical protein